MKNPVLLLAALSLGFSALSAQSVPEFLNYQGTVTDSAGDGLGDSAPVNRKVLFRVYDAATAGSLIWTEEQTVTISKGEFSVLLGQGIAFSPEPHDSLLTVFGEGTTDRYLAITVDNGDGTLNASDLPIAPRQRITSTAYSFRAGTADSIASGSSLKLNTADSGLGYYDAGRTFGGFNISGPVLYGAGGGALGVDNGAGTQTTALRWTSAGNVGIGSADLTGASALTKLVLQGDDISTAPQQLNIRGNTDTNKRLLLGYNTTSNYGSLQAYSGTSTATNLLLNRIGGNVGIGTSNPGDKLEVAGNLRVSAGGLRMWNNSGNDSTRFMTAALVNNEINGLSGNGTDAGQLRLSAGGGSGVQHKSAIDLYGYGTNDMRFFTNGTERMRVASGGYVGIGTTIPTQKLSVSGGYADISGLRLGGQDSANTIYHPTGDIAINTHSSSQKVTIGSNLSGTAMTVTGSSVGVGMSPFYLFDVNGTLRATTIRNNGDYLTNGGASSGIKWMAGGATSNTLQAHIFRWGSDGFNIGDGRLLFTNSGNSNTTGVYLAVGGTSLTSTSDERLKSEIEPITGILDKISDIRVVGFNMATTSVDTETGKMKVGQRPQLRTTKNGKVIKQQIGSIAQDWIASFPELVVEPHNDEGFYGLNYDRIGVVALGAAKELNEIVIKQQAEIADLTARVARLEAKDAARDARLAAIEALLSAK